MYLIVMLIEHQCAGKVEDILYKPGKFFNASLDKASEDNERNYVQIKRHEVEMI